MDPHAQTPDTAALVGVAIEIARRCGRLIADDRPDRLGVAATKSSPVDVVTVMDKRSEELAARLVAELRPGDGLLGEEGSFSPSATGVSWLIDPIDGTVNYLYGIPEYSVSVAAVVGDPRGEFRPVAGAVYQPDHEELFWATADGPAWMRVRGEERELRASPAVDLGLSLVSTGFGYRAELRAAQAQILTRVLPRIRDIRRQGSAALELCYVAAGRQDAYYESGLNAWDLAAGWLIAERAGLTVRGRDGGAPDTDLLLAGRPEILDALQALIEA